jgi:hypothetical protein
MHNCCGTLLRCHTLASALALTCALGCVRLLQVCGPEEPGQQLLYEQRAAGTTAGVLPLEHRWYYKLLLGLHGYIGCCCYCGKASVQSTGIFHYRGFSNVQVLWTLPELRQRYVDAAQDIFRTAPQDPAADFATQFAKEGA